MSAQETDLGTIETQVPARLDRLPWSRFHWMVVIGLGAVWILDGLEVTLVGSIGSRLTEADSGLHLSASQIGTAAAIYVAGAVLGALFFGQLTDRFGRKKLFLITLGVYIAATVATAFAMSPLYFFICRFFTGAGIGGEYSAINSAIDELIPARVRGRVDLIINGSYWLGAAIAAFGSVLLLNTNIFPADLGWRLAFALGALLGLTILIVRRHVPESPRWLFIHGREDEADKIVGDIEKDVLAEIDEDSLPEPEERIEVKQREKVTLREVASTAFKKYPGRTALGLALFTGQAFLYNAVTFDLGTLLGEFYGVASGAVPIFIAIYAISNFAGPLTLGRLFDTVGRRPMIIGTYGAAALGTLILGLLFTQGWFNQYWFMAVLVMIFFFASSGASSAYLTVSEIFPMETRALAIAFFFAVGTGLGGIIGPLLFGHLIESGDKSTMAIGFFIGAMVMAVGAVAEFLWGINAEKKSLEEIAEPLSSTGEGTEGEEDSGPSDSEGREADKSGPDRRAPMPVASPAAVRRFQFGRGNLALARSFPITSSGAPVGVALQVEAIVAALDANGEMSRETLAQQVGSTRWGPGLFSLALKTAVEENRVERASKNSFRVRSKTGSQSV